MFDTVHLFQVALEVSPNYCTRNAFAQALKVSDPSIDGKICKGDNSSGFNTAANAKCKGTSANGSYTAGKAGLSNFAEKSITSAGLNWPKGGSSATNNDNVGNVTTDIMALTKNEKVKVAGHRDVFSSYNKDPKM